MADNGNKKGKIKRVAKAAWRTLMEMLKGATEAGAMGAVAAINIDWLVAGVNLEDAETVAVAFGVAFAGALYKGFKQLYAETTQPSAVPPVPRLPGA